MKVRIINKSQHELPVYQTRASAGVDLRAQLESPVRLESLERAVIGTGLYLELPEGYEAQIRPRSGLAARQGLTVLNSPGTIDADYRGEIGVILVNLSRDAVTIEHGDRIAQMVIARHEQAEWVEVEALNTTQRGSGGFGSTGRN
jgi:dUTP pyrophosphatase